jgi:hypothetical protein
VSWLGGGRSAEATSFGPDLDELAVITSGDDLASARIAEKAGFMRRGSPREEPSGVVLIRRRSLQHGRAQV